MAGDIVCRPIFTVTSCIIGRAVGHCHNEHPFLCQQFTKHFPCFIEVFQMLHHVPKGDHIKATGSKLFQSRFGFYVQIEMLLCKSTCLRTFLHCFHLPSTACHGVGEVSGSRPDIEQTPSFTVCFPCYQARFATQHIGTYIMVDGIHRAFARISVGNVIGSLVILAYLCFYRHTLRERKSAVFTRTQFKLFARSIKIRTSHDAFQVRTATHRTSIYNEFLH